MKFYAPIWNIEGVSWKTSKTEKKQIQEETQKLKFYNSHCHKLQNQIAHQIFDGIPKTLNLVIELGYIIWFYLSSYKNLRSIWVQVSGLFNHTAYVKSW